MKKSEKIKASIIEKSKTLTQTTQPEMEITMTIKYFRGCTMNEAVDLKIAIDSGNFNAHRATTFWTDSKEKAEMYARRHTNGAVVEAEMDEQPRGIQNYFSVGLGDSAATTIRQWELPTAYFVNTFTCYAEEVTIYSI